MLRSLLRGSAREAGRLLLSTRPQPGAPAAASRLLLAARQQHGQGFDVREEALSGKVGADAASAVRRPAPEGRMLVCILFVSPRLPLAHARHPSSTIRQHMQVASSASGAGSGEAAAAAAAAPAPAQAPVDGAGAAGTEVESDKLSVDHLSPQAFSSLVRMRSLNDDALALQYCLRAHTVQLFQALGHRRSAASASASCLPAPSPPAQPAAGMQRAEQGLFPVTTVYHNHRRTSPSEGCGPRLSAGCARRER